MQSTPQDLQTGEAIGNPRKKRFLTSLKMIHGSLMHPNRRPGLSVIANAIYRGKRPAKPLRALWDLVLDHEVELADDSDIRVTIDGGKSFPLSELLEQAEKLSTHDIFS